MSDAPRPLPLSERPRRVRRVKVPTQRSAARTLRRTAPHTTTVSWQRSGLPSYPTATAGVPFSESMVSLLIVVLLCIPVAVWSGFAPWAFITAVAGVLAASYLLWARRVVVGRDYVAVRQIGRYHVASVDHVKHLELRPSQKGGVLCLHTDDGRTMRLRRAEMSRPDVNAALKAMYGTGSGTHDRHVAELLDLPHEEHRLRYRYLADAVQ